MDVDGSSVGPPSGEIDQNLLLQFSCMNTTDREELIGQVQKLLGPGVNYYTASFFLDMNSWNLQAAVCSYLDYCTPTRLPSMSLKAAQSHDEPLLPDARFEQNWNIANTGTDVWPSSCQVAQAGGEPLGATAVYVPPLAPGISTTVTMNLTAPSTPGKHRGYFHLLTDRGEQIGDTLWAEITVESGNTMAIVDQLAAMPIPSSRDDEAGNSSIHQISPSDDQMC